MDLLQMDDLDFTSQQHRDEPSFFDQESESTFNTLIDNIQLTESTPEISSEQPKPVFNLTRQKQPSLFHTYLTCIPRLEDYKPYFNVTTNQVKDRIFYATIGQFMANTVQPDFDDLYVPVWLFITLVVECSIISYCNSTLSSYQVSHVVTIATTMFWLFFAAPLGIYLTSRYNNLPCEFLKIFSILTYSFTIYAPCVLLCFFIYTVPVLLAMSLQIFSLVRKRENWQVKSENNQIQIGVGAGVIFSQVVFGVCMRFLFIN